MKITKSLLIYLLLICGFSPVGFSQNSGSFELYNIEISQKLPTLSALIDSAIKNDPYVRFRDLQLMINECKLKADRTLWTKNIGIQTDVRYGTFDNFSTNTSEGQSPALLATKSNQTNYGVGAYIKLPFYDLVNRKNQINLSKTEVKQAESMAEVQRNEVRQLVIRQYNDLILKQRLLKIKSKTLETSRINMEMVEKEFQMGTLPLSEYSRISEVVSRSEADFEVARIDFNTAYLILQEIVGFKFNFENTINATNEGN